MSIVIIGGSGGGGSTDWSAITSKPTVSTTIGDPGSDANLTSEQAVRESLDVVGAVGIAYTHAAPGNFAYIITDDCPVAGVFTKATFKSRSGTVTADVRINGTSVTSWSSLSITSARASATPTAAKTVAVGDVIDVLFSAGATPVDVSLTLWLERTI